MRYNFKYLGTFYGEFLIQMEIGSPPPQPPFPTEFSTFWEFWKVNGSRQIVERNKSRYEQSRDMLPVISFATVSQPILNSYSKTCDWKSGGKPTGFCLFSLVPQPQRKSQALRCGAVAPIGVATEQTSTTLRGILL